MTDSPVIAIPALGQAWEGDWRARVLERLHVRGFYTISEFAESRPTASLIALAEELSTSDTDRTNRADVCAEQISRLWRDEVGKQGPNAAEHMARRLLVGELYLDLPQGWANDWTSSEDSLSRISMAMSSWTAHVGPKYEHAADRVIHGMLDEGPTGRIPNGWLPANSEDPILLDIFARYWREPS